MGVRFLVRNPSRDISLSHGGFKETLQCSTVHFTALTREVLKCGSINSMPFKSVQHIQVESRVVSPRYLSCKHFSVLRESP